MVREFGTVRSKSSRKQKDGGRIYKIRYKVGQQEKEIRFKEVHDTDASFHSGDKITIDTNDDFISISNNTIGISVEGTKV